MPAAVADGTGVKTFGAKAANLGELIAAGLPVPGGFAVTAVAYLDSLEEAGLRDPIAELAASTHHMDDQERRGASAEARALVHQAGMPEDLAAEVRSAYDELGGGPVAVRSSATGEDAADSSFAGTGWALDDVEIYTCAASGSTTSSVPSSSTSSSPTTSPAPSTAPPTTVPVSPAGFDPVAPARVFDTRPGCPPPEANRSPR